MSRESKAGAEKQVSLYSHVSSLVLTGVRSCLLTKEGVKTCEGIVSEVGEGKPVRSGKTVVGKSHFPVLAPAYRTIYFIDLELCSTWKNQGRQEKVKNKEGQS